MDEYFRWNINIPRALYNELKHMSIDEGKPLSQFCKPALDILTSELVKLRNETLATRKKQLEEAQNVIEDSSLSSEEKHS